MTPKQEQRLKKARQRVCKVLDIAGRHTGTVAHEIAMHAAQALAEIDAAMMPAAQPDHEAIREDSE
jgi:sRNA-binding protein